MDGNLKKKILTMKDELMLFTLLNNEEMELLVPYLELLLYNAGETLFEEGDTGDFLAFIVSGRVQAKKHTEFKGKQIVLATLEKGSLVGEMSIVNPGEPRSASVVALEASEFVIVKRDSLDALTEEYPLIGIKILKGLIRILAIRLQKADERFSIIF
jgi:CRP-like cAMP-binding protein